MIKANDPSKKSWLNIPADSGFPIQNLPFGIFSSGNRHPRVGVAIGQYILDLAELNKAYLLNDLGISQHLLETEYLNELISLGKPAITALRNKISDLLSEENPALRDNEDYRAVCLVEQKDAKMHLPVQVGDYTDFYSSIEHATNVGKMFRDPANALLPNWRHLPVGYHGRSSSIVVSGTDIRRPKGQTKPDENAGPVFGPSRLLDFELEMGFIIGRNTQLGESIPVNKAMDYIFGLVLFNDWSARDIQKWEYVPLGPFLAKNFASTMAPWVVTMDALEPFRVKGPVQEPEVLPYLQWSEAGNYDINLEAYLQPENGKAERISRTNFKYMYWNMAQQLAHHTVNGCNVRVGDVMASGTISGESPDSFGSMLELTWGGKNPLKLSDGSERKFLQDHDTFTITGFAEKDGIRIGFGEATGKILPAN